MASEVSRGPGLHLPPRARSFRLSLLSTGVSSPAPRLADGGSPNPSRPSPHAPKKGEAPSGKGQPGPPGIAPQHAPIPPAAKPFKRNKGSRGRGRGSPLANLARVLTQPRRPPRSSGFQVRPSIHIQDLCPSGHGPPQPQRSDGTANPALPPRAPRRSAKEPPRLPHLRPAASAHYSQFGAQPAPLALTSFVSSSPSPFSNLSSLLARSRAVASNGEKEFFSMGFARKARTQSARTRTHTHTQPWHPINAQTLRGGPRHLCGCDSGVNYEAYFGAACICIKV